MRLPNRDWFGPADVLQPRRRSAEPWSIDRSDPRTGDGRVALQRRRAQASIGQVQADRAALGDAGRCGMGTPLRYGSRARPETSSGHGNSMGRSKRLCDAHARPLRIPRFAWPPRRPAAGSNQTRPHARACGRSAPREGALPQMTGGRRSETSCFVAISGAWPAGNSFVRRRRETLIRIKREPVPFGAAAIFDVDQSSIRLAAPGCHDILVTVRGWLFRQCRPRAWRIASRCWSWLSTGK